MSENDQKIEFFYWAMRGKPHVARLLLQHLEIPYKERTFKTPESWYVLGNELITELPCLKDGELKVYETIPIIEYLLKKHNFQSYLGKTIKDQAHVEMHLWSLSILFKKMVAAGMQDNKSNNEQIRIKEEFWATEIEKKLRPIEEFPLFDEWFLGYMSVMDFLIYELVSYLRVLYPQIPNRVEVFGKLVAV